MPRVEAASPLSSRQREVLDRRLQGQGRRQIAQALGLSKRTIDAEFDRARAALGAADELDLLLHIDRERRLSA